MYSKLRLSLRGGTTKQSHHIASEAKQSPDFDTFKKLQYAYPELTLYYVCGDTQIGTSLQSLTEFAGVQPGGLDFHNRRSTTCGQQQPTTPPERRDET
jgi:hypothetical protein